MQLFDTHCHIHSADYLDGEAAYKRAVDHGVVHMLCVGTGVEDSKRAIAFADTHEGVFTAIGVHPHDTKEGVEQLQTLPHSEKIVAVGEIGLDYYYGHSQPEVQKQALEWQLQLARDRDLPVIFHVREAFDDFWPIFDNFSGIRGVLHSFTDTQENVEKGLTRGLFIGVNGISTFTKVIAQRDMYRQLPLEKILLETDAPYLTPLPYRGKVNEPAYVRMVAEHISTERSTSVEEIATITSHNATHLFQI